MNTPTLQGFTSALSRTAPDTKDKTAGRKPARISQNRQSPKSSASQDAPGATIMPENLPNGGSQNGKAKSSKAQTRRPDRPPGQRRRGWTMRPGGTSQRRSARSVTSDPRRRGVGCPVS